MLEAISYSPPVRLSSPGQSPRLVMDIQRARVEEDIHHQQSSAESEEMDEFEQYRARAYSASGYGLFRTKREKRDSGIETEVPVPSLTMSPPPVVVTIKADDEPRCDVDLVQETANLYLDNEGDSHRRKRSLRRQQRLSPNMITERNSDQSSHFVFKVNSNLLGLDMDTEESQAMASSSIHHKRSYSCRNRIRKSSEGSESHPMRPRTRSMPSRSSLKKHRNSSRSDEPEEYYRVRTFSTSSKGVINRGDSYKKKNGTRLSVDEYPLRKSGSVTSQGSSMGSVCSLGDAPVLRVLMLGGPGVGKTSLLQQFRSSDYMGSLDSTVEDDEEEEVTAVPVLVDGDESTLHFVNVHDTKALTHDTEADGHVIVYSVTDSDSFDEAVETLDHIRKGALSSTSAIILVANKGDIVRNRVVSEEDGRSTAIRYTCKYIEVSAVMDHKVDELLVGIVKQIRLNIKRLAKNRRRPRCLPDETGCVQSAAKGIMGRLFKRNSRMSHSCDNLLVL